MKRIASLPSDYFVHVKDDEKKMEAMVGHVLMNHLGELKTLTAILLIFLQINRRDGQPSPRGSNLAHKECPCGPGGWVWSQITLRKITSQSFKMKLKTTLEE